MPKSIVFLGCLTLEDIMEQLIQERIEDEYEASIDDRDIIMQQQEHLTNSTPIFQSLTHPNVRPAIKRAKLRVQRKASKMKEGNVELISRAKDDSSTNGDYPVSLLSDTNQPLSHDYISPQEKNESIMGSEEVTGTDVKTRLLDSE